MGQLLRGQGLKARTCLSLSSEGRHSENNVAPILHFDNLRYIVRYILMEKKIMFEQEKSSERHREWQRGEHSHRGEERHRGRHGGFGGPMGHDRGFGGGGGRERHFDNGELRFVILQLIADKPSYGYEIIKAIEERLSGAYAPSPGVVYPTLTMLEEEGFAAVSSTEGSKKLYAATEQGLEYLKENKVMLKAIFGRMEQAGKAFGRGRSPQIMRAIMNLRYALKIRTERGNLSPEQIRKVAEAIDGAARVIDEV
jgi:DNA-binding PadR family transcriptional regulator